jgi:hypothetical protein
MKFLNLNSLQTVLSAILATLPVMLVNLGCTLDSVTQKLDCSTAWFAPELLGYVALAIGFIKLVVIPAIDNGGWFRNLFSPKVPVSASGEPGTVTQRQVQSTTAGDPKK